MFAVAIAVHAVLHLCVQHGVAARVLLLYMTLHAITSDQMLCAGGLDLHA